MENNIHGIRTNYIRCYRGALRNAVDSIMKSGAKTLREYNIYCYIENHKAQDAVDRFEAEYCLKPFIIDTYLNY